MSEGSARLDVVQVLRGVAALLVVGYHGVGYQTASHGDGIEGFISRTGASGVDLFFMISGFIMVYATRKSSGGAAAAAEFLAKRVARVFPVYLVVTLVYVLTMLVLGAFVGHTDITTDPGNILASVLMIPMDLGSIPPFFGGSVLHVGWTINYEMYFYAIFAVSILAGRWQWFLLVSLFIGTLVCMPLLTGGYVTMDAYYRYANLPGYLNLVSSPMIWEFLIGALVGRVYLSKFTMSKVAASLLMLFSVTFLAWFMISLTSLQRFGLTGWALPYAMLLFAFVVGSKSAPLRWPTALVWVGNVSFSLYLVHPLIIHPVFQALRDRLVPGGLMESIWFVLMVVVASLALASISHRVLEMGLSEFVRVKLLSTIQSYNAQSSLPVPLKER